MALVVKDRVKETTTTTGTGALSLAGAITGFRTFASVCSVNDTVYYGLHAVDGAGAPTGDWEVGLGTYSATNTLTRTTILASSNSGSAVSLSSGTKQVWIDIAASDYATVRTNAIAVGASLTPGTIGGLVLWVDGSVLQGTSGDTVGWLPSADTVHCPTTVSANSSGVTIGSTQLNSLNVAHFSGTTNAACSILQKPQLNAVTIFVVHKPGSMTSGAVPTFIGGQSSSLTFRLNATATDSAKFELIKTSVAGIGTGSTSNVTTGTAYQANVTYSDSSGAWAYRINRAAAGSGTNIQSITAASDSFAWSTSSPSSTYLNGDIAELIVYNRVLSSTEITTIENYLNAKWGV